MRRAIFLDRDGVLNRALARDGRPYPPATLDQLEILPDAKAACAALRAAGYVLIVVTNQPDIARGTQSTAVLQQMNNRLAQELKLDDVRTCPHDDSDQCGCRKPAPGLLLEAARDWDVDLSESFMIGDRWRDVEAGKKAGCRTVFIDSGYREKRPSSPDYTVTNLGEAADWILRTAVPATLVPGTETTR